MKKDKRAIVKFSDSVTRDTIVKCIGCLPQDAKLVGCFVDHPRGVAALVFESKEFREATAGQSLPVLRVTLTGYEDGEITATWEYE